MRLRNDEPRTEFILGIVVNDKVTVHKCFESEMTTFIDQRQIWKLSEITMNNSVIVKQRRMRKLPSLVPALLLLNCSSWSYSRKNTSTFVHEVFENHGNLLLKHFLQY